MKHCLIIILSVLQRFNTIIPFQGPGLTLQTSQHEISVDQKVGIVDTCMYNINTICVLHVALAIKDNESGITFIGINSNSPLSRTQTHSPCPCFSVIYYRLTQTPVISNYFLFPLGVRVNGPGFYCSHHHQLTAVWTMLSFIMNHTSLSSYYLVDKIVQKARDNRF